MILNDDEYLRYAKQMLLHGVGEAGQLQLKSARVLCIGAGGLGSVLLDYLCRAGVGSLGIMDDDVVEISNLHRQILYTTASIGKQKAIAAREILLAINPQVQITAYPERFDLHRGEAVLPCYDLIADCTDNFEARYLINQLCLELNKPWVFASVQQLQGHCSLFIPQQTACFRCLFPQIDSQGPFLSCEEEGILGTTPGMLGIVQAQEVLKYFLKLPGLAGKLFQVNLNEMSFSSTLICVDPACTCQT